MSETKKRIGDRVIVTGGQFKSLTGTIIQQQPRGWVVELEDTRQVTIPFPLLRLTDQPQVEEPAFASINEEPEPSQDLVTTENDLPGASESASNPEEEPQPLEETVTEEIESFGALEQEQISEVEEVPIESSGEPTDSPTKPVAADLTKLSVIQLKEVAQQRGVSVARTKEDFLRIIKEKHPEEDLDRLKGKALFDRVSELHISRLRSKQDLVARLSSK